MPAIKERYFNRTSYERHLALGKLEAELARLGLELDEASLAPPLPPLPDFVPDLDL